MVVLKPQVGCTAAIMFVAILAVLVLVGTQRLDLLLAEVVEVACTVVEAVATQVVAEVDRVMRCRQRPV
jgi:hypothetical protein